MAKKKKVAATSKLTARKTEAPMLVERPVEPEVATTQVPREDIARLAFAKFAARGYVQGRAVEDWLAAEAELRVAAIH